LAGMPGEGPEPVHRLPERMHITVGVDDAVAALDGDELCEVVHIDHLRVPVTALRNEDRPGSGAIGGRRPVAEPVARVARTGDEAWSNDECTFAQLADGLFGRDLLPPVVVFVALLG